MTVASNDPISAIGDLLTRIPDAAIGEPLAGNALR